MLKGYKVLFNLIDIVAKKYMPLFLVQMFTFGAIMATDILFMPIIMRILFDSMQTGVLSNILIVCGISATFLMLMVLVNYINNVIVDLNFFKASYGIAAQSFMMYHELPFYKMRKYESGDVFNRINSAGASIAFVLVFSVSTIAITVDMLLRGLRNKPTKISGCRLIYGINKALAI